MTASYRFVVYGRVQGVGFRASAQRKALFLGLRGWVRNRADGAVEGAATGTQDDLAEFRKWLDHGPPGARVERVEWTVGDDDGEESFLIRR